MCHRNLLRGTRGFLLLLSLGTAACGGGTVDASAVRPVSADQAQITAALAFARARQAADGRDWSAALAAAEQAVAADPRHDSAHLDAGWAAWCLGQPAKAAAHYQAVRGTTRARALLWQAHSLAACGEWAAAARCYAERSASSYPSYWSPVALPGSAEVSNYDQMVLHWKKVAKDHPKVAVAAWLLANALAWSGRWDEARAACADAQRLTPQWPPAQLTAAGIESRRGNLAAARDLVEQVLATAPGHVGALALRFELETMAPDWSAAAIACERLLARVGRSLDASTLVRGAEAAWRAGDADRAIQCTNAVVEWAGSHLRVQFGDSDEALLKLFAAGRPPGAATDPVGRYALASALFGCVCQLLDGDANPVLGSLRSLLEKVNQPTAADAQLAAGQRREGEAAAGKLDFAGMFAANVEAALVPHLGRCVRELEAALAARPDFRAAQALLAAIVHRAGAPDRHRELLEAILAAAPEATSVRLRLGKLLPLDRALDNLEPVPIADRGSLAFMCEQASLLRRSGNHAGAAAQSLAILRAHGSYWDVQETLGLSLVELGQHEAALTCLEFSTPLGRTAAGQVALAELRIRLGKPGIVAALIDAWRAAPNGSAEEARASQLLRQRDTTGCVCQRCAGGGQVTETSGNTGQYGHISTYNVRCPQCLGLGLWHPKVHGR